VYGFPKANYTNALSNAVGNANNLKPHCRILEAIKSKLAEMADEFICWCSQLSYRAAKNIEDRIAMRLAAGNTSGKPELKGV